MNHNLDTKLCIFINSFNDVNTGFKFIFLWYFIKNEGDISLLDDIYSSEHFNDNNVS